MAELHRLIRDVFSYENSDKVDDCGFVNRYYGCCLVRVVGDHVAGTCIDSIVVDLVECKMTFELEFEPETFTLWLGVSS